MHIRFEKKANTKCDSDILSLSWMGRVPDKTEVSFKLIIVMIYDVLFLILYIDY